MTRCAETDPAVQAIVASVFVQNVGAAAVLPLLPLYLRSQHLPVSLVGLVMASYFAAALLTQYPAGHLADRAGHRRVMVAGLAIYAAASVSFALPVGAGGYVGLRALQGVGAGAFQISGLALVGVLVDLERRGRAFSRVFAAQIGGLAVGPVFGAIAGVDRMNGLFVLSAFGSVVATVPAVTRTPRQSTSAAGEAGPSVPLRLSRPLAGVVLVGVIGGLCTGVYETCWSLLMSSRHAAQWQIGLSWTLFAGSFAAFSPAAGRLTDRVDRRTLAIAGISASTGFLVVYPFLPRPALLMALGVVEAIGVSVAFPAAQSLLSQCAPVEALGRAQGLFATAESAAIAVMAATAGWLLGVARWLPFAVGAAAAAALIVTLPGLWRDVVGRAADAVQPLADVPEQPEPLTLTPLA